MKVVIDTNVFISALMFGGNPRKILDKIISGNLQLYLSEAIIKEISEVLKRPIFGIPYSIVNQIITELSAISELVNPSRRINIIKADPTDNKILECAVEVKAEYIISGDKHLLELKSYRSIKIVNPHQFLCLEIDIL